LLNLPPLPPQERAGEASSPEEKTG